MINPLKPNPYLVFDIDVLVKRSMLGRRSPRLAGIFVAKYMSERFNTNLAVVEDDTASKKYLEKFGETYGFGVQQYIPGHECEDELFYMDRSGLFIGGILHDRRVFNPISTKMFYTYKRDSEIDAALLSFQGAVL